MEVYAFGFRNQSGSSSSPRGRGFETALAVSDNGANDLGNRRIANGAEKIWLVTEMGQDAGYPDKEGFLFVTSKRYGWTHYEGATRSSGHTQICTSARSRSFRPCGRTSSSITSPACAACR